MFIRYTVAIIIPGKTTESITEAFLDNWMMKMFGPPARILHYNGG